MGVRLNDQTVSGASKISFTFHVWYRSLILDDVKLAELSNNSCESNNVTYIPVGQNILWPFLRISGVKTSQPPGYTPTDTFKRNLKTHLCRRWLNFCSATKTELVLKSEQPHIMVKPRRRLLSYPRDTRGWHLFIVCCRQQVVEHLCHRSFTAVKPAIGGLRIEFSLFYIKGYHDVNMRASTQKLDTV